MGGLWQDLRYGSRALIGNPLFTAAVVLSLGLGIGLNTAVFSFLQSLFLDPVPGVVHPDRVVTVYNEKRGGDYFLPVSVPNYRDFREQCRSFSQLGAYQMVKVGLATGGRAEQVSGEMVTADFFALLGVRPRLGRGFLAAEDRGPGMHPVAILSHGLWRRRFAAAPDILGRKVLLNGHPFTVVGVAPESFRGTNSIVATDLWVPLAMYPAVYSFPDLIERRDGQAVQLLGRLRPGVTLAAARSEMKAVAARLEREYPKENEKLSVALFPMDEAAVPPNQRAVFVQAGLFLSLVAGLLLVLACFNVANLLLARTLARAREIAIRLSLGAGRGRLARQLLTESLLLALGSGAFGFLLALAGQGLLWKLRPPYFTSQPPALLDARMIGFALALSIATGVAFGTVPLSLAARSDLAAALKTGSPLSGRRGVAGEALIGAQAVVGTVLLAMAGFFLVSLYNARRIDPGFDTRHLVSVSLDLRSQGYDEAQGRRFQERLAERARALPGAQGATLAENRLLGGFRLWRSASPLGTAPDPESSLVGSSLVDDRYFAVAGIPVLRGRAFAPRDRAGAAPVAIVNETMARRLWPGRDPVGRSLHLDDEPAPVEVIGEVRDTKHQSLAEGPHPFLYLPLAQRYSPRVTVIVRTHGEPAGLLPALRRTVQELDPTLPLLDANTVAGTVQTALWMPRLGVALLSLFAGLALALAALGIYGITAQGLSLRGRELGIRMALGASQAAVLRLCVGRVMTAVAVGLAGGLVGAAALKGWLALLVYRGEAGDAVVLPGIAVLLAAVGLAASLVPAMQAVGVGPAVRLHDP